jgi:mannose-6-phosphate isomerase-like protein (cupin superfamily)
LSAFGQEHKSLREYQPTEEFDNIHVLKIAEDEKQSSFIIWVKKGVKGHFHQTHTENLVVIEGKAIMTLGDKTITIKKGDYINIPDQTPHSVTEVLSRKPLKVLSIQSPLFDGKDRIFIEK